jgi:hypothetical protein
VEEVHLVSNGRKNLAGMPADETTTFAMNNDLGGLFETAEVVREWRRAKMVTALQIDLDIQAETRRRPPPGA